MPPPQEHVAPLLKYIFSLIIVVGVLMIIAGVFLVALGGDGASHFTLFGQGFRSRNAGVAAIFIGAVMIVLTLRRILATLDRTIEHHRGSER